MFKTIPPSVYLIAVGAFALGMASYVTAGLIPMIEQAFGVQVAVAAQLVTVFSLAYGIGSPVVVALLPPHRQRFGLLCALAIFVLANAASAVVDDFAVLLVCRAVAGLGAGVYLATGITACAALSAPQQRGRAIAVIMGGMACGTVLGVPLSLLLASQSGWQAALWLVALLGAAAWLGLLVKLPVIPAGPGMTLHRKLSLLADRKVMTILLVSLLAAVSSLGMYTFIAPFMHDPAHGGVDSVTPYLWIWGLGGVVGSFLVAPLVERIQGPLLTLIIMLVLTASLLVLPAAAALSPWLAMIPVAVWGCVGWALQIPQNNELLAARDRHGDGNLAVALNESALYMGSALGAGAGGLLLLLEMPSWTLAISAAAVALLGAVLQILNVRASRSHSLERAFGPSAR
ncbi:MULTISPECIES: MFS transporter [unclassified Pseudomonas]|uniref:MFS transporter n=1 Tax=unclassified Pseudomonas TaxID=196821 RepID=UPI000BA3EBAB|nr:MULTISPECIES: MFS transporter [unclassified Pseudomonas]